MDTKHFSFFFGLFFVLSLSFVAASQAQQGPLVRGSEAYRNYCRKAIEDAVAEKMHGEGGVEKSSISTESESFDGLRTLGAFNEELVNTNAIPQSENHAAINLKDSTNIVVSAMRLASSLIMPIFYTKDFGKTWKQSSFRTTPINANYIVGGGGDPILTFDADGKLYISWINIYIAPTYDTEFEAIFWASSTDGGVTFTRSGQSTISYIVQPLSQGSFQEFADKEWMTVDRTNSVRHNTLYCAYVVLSPSLGENIRLARKSPQQTNFGTSTIVSPDSLVTVQFTSIGVDRTGGLHVTYLGSTDGATYGLYHSYSTDGGATFRTCTLISEIDVPNMSQDAIGDTLPGVIATRDYPCPHLTIDTSGEAERMYMVWSAFGTSTNLLHGTDIYLSYSDDLGASWSKARVLNDDPVTGYTDHFYPSIAVNRKGVVSVTWYDHRIDPNDLLANYEITHSYDRGSTWTADLPVTGAPTDFSTVGNLNGGFGIGEYTQVLTTDNYSIPVWIDGRDGTGDLNIYAAFVPLDGTAGVRLEQVDGAGDRLQNYPNPASLVTTLNYGTASRQHVELAVTNLLGETLKTLRSGMQEAGHHTQSFSTTDLPNGTYFLRLVCDGAVETRSFVVRR